MRSKGGDVAGDGIVQPAVVVRGDEQGERVGQPLDVPEPDLRLRGEAVPGSVVARVARPRRVVDVEEAERAVVERQPRDAHVVRVQHAVHEPCEQTQETGAPTGPERNRAGQQWASAEHEVGDGSA